ncbi:hypothetical protein FNV66_02210 [Streptomyces sp. S1D4-14]|nr:hypothetical protein FNV67_02580 [Streptomyces sp. S1D4-20]QDN64623.1 hypothetical protein FNV66_02210 [Streptomyces sp. S1D4-14]QDN74945.1 hypothetical protein FNV64_04085 [Streptomyces sp. S1A1-7]QDO47030.1 hypothetical protein FNV60_00445 [Streptomyces sp. RLB3-5]QDO57272.1 hypothetical protein FNV59_02680 [Streptomyces sp. RLB1-8]
MVDRKDFETALLLEQRECAARRRVDEQLSMAERDWNEWVIAWPRVGEVLAPGEGDVAGPDVAVDLPDGGEQPVPAGASEPAKSKSVVPMGRAGLVWSALSVDYRRILRVLADCHRLGQGPLSCQEMAVCFGLEVVPSKVEALRSKAKRMVARGWLVEPVPGRFSLSQAVAAQGEGL